METKIIKGDKVKEKIFTEVKTEVFSLREQYQTVPGIAFIGFSCVPLAKYNIPLHVQMAGAMGFNVFTEIMEDSATEEDVFNVIERFNADNDIHAIVILQPLPLHLSPIRIVNKIDPRKEVEGFHPRNMIETLIPELNTNRYPMCLPAALYEMFREEGLEVQKGKEWVFVLDDEFFSNALTYMVVRSAASRVVPKESPVTFVNKNYENMPKHVKRADYLVIVTKFPEYIRPEWLNQGVCIIDIYSNLVKEIPSKNDPSKLVPVIRGGVNVPSVNGIAGFILPIPGGLMTVVLAILFRNTVMSFKYSMNNH